MDVTVFQALLSQYLPIGMANQGHQICIARAYQPAALSATGGNKSMITNMLKRLLP